MRSGTVGVMAIDVAELTESDLEAHRNELRAHCYRMLASATEAEDAVQDTLVRAWRSADRFEGRSSVRTWLYRIATNVCLDHLAARQRRARPMEIGHEGVGTSGPLGAALPESTWVEPYPDARLISSEADPAERVALAASVRLALVAALQHLPPRQRAVLLLREVLRWKADEVAELLDTSVASVNSALQRARATLAALDDSLEQRPEQVVLDTRATELLERYVDAFERYDMAALTEVLHHDAIMNMPPYALWLRGPQHIADWMLGPGAECEGSRVVPTRANGTIAFGQYRRSASGQGHEPWSLTVLEVRGDRIGCVTAFLDTAHLFPIFDLPERLD